MMNFMVVLQVEYDDTDNVTPREVKEQLLDAIDHLADNGLLSGDLDVTVSDWTINVQQL
mgnify:CR=1 FL=1